jgi:HSP20 family protein
MKRLKDLIPWRKKEEVQVHSPETTFQQVAPETDDFFDLVFPDFGFSPRRMFHKDQLFPRMDIKEEKKKITVEAELPGVQASDVDVALDGRMLTVKAQKKSEHESNSNGYYHYERSYGRYNRTITLPADVDPVKVDASLQNGVLKIKMHKLKESEAKRIEVKTV